MNVVEADDRDIVGHLVRRAMKTVEDTNGCHVVGTDDGGGHFSQLKKVFGGLDPALHSVRPFDDVLERNGKPEFQHRLEECITTGDGGTHVQWSADESDIAVTERG